MAYSDIERQDFTLRALLEADIVVFFLDAILLLMTILFTSKKRDATFDIRSWRRSKIVIEGSLG